MVFSINGAGTIGYPYGKKKNFGQYLVPHIKVNSKWTTDLNVEPKMITLLEKNKSKIFVTLG